MKAASRFMSKRAHTSHTHPHTHVQNIRLSSPHAANLPRLRQRRRQGTNATWLSEEERSTPSHSAPPPPLLTTPINIANRKHMGDAPLPVVEQAPGVPMDAVSVHHTQTCGMQGGRVGRGMTRDVLANVALLACLIPSPPSLHTYTFSLCATCSVCRVREGGAQWWWWYCWRRRRRRRGRRRRRRRRRSELRDAR